VTRLCSSRTSVVFHHLDNGHYWWNISSILQFNH